jgi:DNA adenine methylase
MDTIKGPRSVRLPKRQVLRYYGSKRRIAPWLISHFPEHDNYIEPFFGGGEPFFSKQPSKNEIINDMNREVVNFFYVLREKFDEFVQAIQLTPYARNEIDLANETAKAPPAWTWDDEQKRYRPVDFDEVELARRFYVRSRQGRSGNSSAWRTTWRCEYTRKRARSYIDDFNGVKHIFDAAERLKCAQIENMDALDLIRKYDTPESLFYVDPPYPRETRGQSWRQAYAYEMTTEQHQELGGLLRNIEGMAIISSYPNRLYDQMFSDWHCETIETYDNLKQVKIEAVWINPQCWGRLLRERADMKPRQAVLFR